LKLKLAEILWCTPPAGCDILKDSRNYNATPWVPRGALKFKLGFAWFCLDLLGFVWLCLALLGFALLCLALLDSA
jgi:hypothetical protein